MLSKLYSVYSMMTYIDKALHIRQYQIVHSGIIWLVVFILQS